MTQDLILIVDDDPLQQGMLSTLVTRNLTLTPTVASNGQEAIEKFKQSSKSIKLVIMDIDMPIMNGLDALAHIRQASPDTPVIMLTGSKNMDDAITAMKLGAYDFITKPYKGERMIITIKNALKLVLLATEVSRLKQENGQACNFAHMIGHNGGLKECIKLGRRVASSDIPALITGPTGSGKELFSRAIHGESPRSNAPFIAVNCGAIPAQLIESTLFGHEKGAFTGATQSIPGKFREADGGTIFLDEIGELPLDAQVKLLRTLQEKEVETIGAAKPIPVNIRIISATNRNLEEEVANGNFREDLYFRLNVMEIRLPKLKDRAEDIPLLTKHFAERFCTQNNHITPDIPAQILSQLSQHDWPGNVRELENAVHRAIVMCDENQLSEQHFPNLHHSINADQTISAQNRTVPQNQNFLHNHNGSLKTVDEIEHQIMLNALAHFQNNVTHAAQAIGMAKSTFYRKLAQHHIQIR